MHRPHEAVAITPYVTLQSLASESYYSESDIKWLIKKGIVKAEHHGGVWLVNYDYAIRLAPVLRLRRILSSQLQKVA